MNNEKAQIPFNEKEERKEYLDYLVKKYATQVDDFFIFNEYEIIKNHDITNSEFFTIKNYLLNNNLLNNYKFI